MTIKKLLVSEKYVLTSAKTLFLNLPKIGTLTGCDTTSYFYRIGKIKVFKKLLGQPDLCFLFILKSPTTLLKMLTNSLEQSFTMEIRKRNMSIPDLNYTKV